MVQEISSSHTWFCIFTDFVFISSSDSSTGSARKESQKLTSVNNVNKTTNISWLSRVCPFLCSSSWPWVAHRISLPYLSSLAPPTEGCVVFLFILANKCKEGRPATLQNISQFGFLWLLLSDAIRAAMTSACLSTANVDFDPLGNWCVLSPLCGCPPRSTKALGGDTSD